MKLYASEIRVGMLIEYKNDLWQVLKTQHVKPGKGGAFYSSKTKLVKYRADLKILRWAKKITSTPIVAIGGIKLNNYKKLLLNKANFLAISSYIWNNKRYKPLEAIRKLK
jgi:thiamine monophosphate synthase